MTGNGQKPILYFIHVPKTAGSSMRSMISRHYGEGLLLLYMVPEQYEEWKKQNPLHHERISCVYGHYRYGIHTLSGRPFEYTAIMRDPADALMSYFYFILRGSAHPWHQELCRLTFEQFLYSSSIGHFQNFQTGFLTGNDHPQAEDALQNIAKYFPIVGITEMFHETVYLMRKRYGWGAVEVPYENVTLNRPKREQLSAESLLRIQQICAQDAIVYQMAKSRLTDAVSRLSDPEKAELAAFKKTGRLG